MTVTTNLNGIPSQPDWLAEYRLLYEHFHYSSTNCFPADINQIVTRFPGRQPAAPQSAHCCSQPAAANPCAINSNAINSTSLGCSQPANQPTRHRCKIVGLHAGSIRKMSLFFGNDDPYYHKTQQMFCTWSVRICVPNFAIVWHSI